MLLGQHAHNDAQLRKRTTCVRRSANVRLLIFGVVSSRRFRSTSGLTVFCLCARHVSERRARRDCFIFTHHASKRNVHYCYIHTHTHTCAYKHTFYICKYINTERKREATRWSTEATHTHTIFTRTHFTHFHIHVRLLDIVSSVFQVGD